MEDDALVHARALVEDREGVLVGVAVVDLQGEAGALRHVDVRAEGFLLRLAARVGGAEIVQAALPTATTIGSSSRASTAARASSRGTW